MCEIEQWSAHIWLAHMWKGSSIVTELMTNTIAIYWSDDETIVFPSIKLHQSLFHRKFQLDFICP